VQYGTDAPKRIVGWHAMAQVEKRREPLRLGVSPMFALAPMLRLTNRRKTGEGKDCLQGVHRGRMLTTWAVDNGEKSNHLGTRPELGHGAILSLQ
jgi:hypothetical protein